MQIEGWKWLVAFIQMEIHGPSFHLFRVQLAWLCRGKKATLKLFGANQHLMAEVTRSVFAAVNGRHQPTLTHAYTSAKSVSTMFAHSALNPLIQSRGVPGVVS